jgi:hypothetical protein
VLLAGVPLVDVVMLVASVIDLHNGALVSFSYSLDGKSERKQPV